MIRLCGNSVEGAKIAVLGLTFIPITEVMREATRLDLIPALQEAGARIRVFDPAGMEAARPLLNGVVCCDDAYHAMQDADALVIVTEWNEFRALDLQRVKETLKTPCLIDRRNLYNPAEMAAAGFRYSSVGRPSADSEQLNQEAPGEDAPGGEIFE